MSKILLKNLRNRKIRERNRADFLRFADLRLKWSRMAVTEISSSDKLRIEDD